MTTKHPHPTGGRRHDRGALAEFLRARRRDARLDGGLSLDPGVRRGPGLRRAELARAAGVSAPYYSRLEQGINRNPSSQVVDALAGALRLPAGDRAYLRRLAGLATPVEPFDACPAALQPLVRALGENVCLVVTPTAAVVDASNPCRTLLPGLRPGVNLVRWLFLDPTVRTRLGNWTAVATREVAALRFELGAQASDDDLRSVVGDLQEQSREFAAVWRSGRACDDHSGFVGIVVADELRCFQYETLHLSRSRLKFRVYMPADSIDVRCWDPADLAANQPT